MTRPRRPKWDGPTIRRRVAMLLTRDGSKCWLCGHDIAPGSESIDHVLPYKTHPNLLETPSNWRLAHLTRPGTPTGCTHPGCHCPGNKGRKAQPWTAPPSRSW